MPMPDSFGTHVLTLVNACVLDVSERMDGNQIIGKYQPPDRILDVGIQWRPAEIPWMVHSSRGKAPSAHATRECECFKTLWISSG